MSVDDAPMSLAVPEERVDPSDSQSEVEEDDKMRLLIRIKRIAEEEH